MKLFKRKKQPPEVDPKEMQRIIEFIQRKTMEQFWNSDFGTYVKDALDHFGEHLLAERKSKLPYDHWWPPDPDDDSDEETIIN